MFPTWLHAISIAALLLGAACSLLLSAQVIRHPQHMTVMNVVWPISATSRPAVSSSGLSGPAGG